MVSFFFFRVWINWRRGLFGERMRFLSVSVPWLLVLQVNLANMSSLGDVKPVETQVSSNRDADQENKDK